MIPALGRSPGEGNSNKLQYSWVSPVAQLEKNLPAMQVDLGLIPALGRSPGGGHGNPLQDSGLENIPMDKGACQATDMTKHSTERFAAQTCL